MEIWKAIPGYEHYYEVSNKGRIRSVERIVKSKLPGGTIRKIKRSSKILKPKINKRGQRQGYQQVYLARNGQRKMVYVHRMVLLAFTGPSDLICNHKNGITTDNRIENLEYCTYKENRIHAVQVLRVQSGKKIAKPYSGISSSLSI